VQVVSGSFVWLLSNMRDLESNDLRLESWEAFYRCKRAAIWD
jgi:hypothetical protein